MTDTLDVLAGTPDGVLAAPTLTLTVRDPSASAATVVSPGAPRPDLGGGTRLPTVHRGLDASVNVLYLDVTLSGIAATLSDVELLLVADGGALEDDALALATVTTPPGWRAESDLDWFTGQPTIRLRPMGEIVLDGTPYTATFVLSDMPSGDGESGNGSLTVVPRGLPAPITPYALDLPLAAVNVNAGALVIGWSYDTPGEVIVTPSGRSSPVPNDLALVITNHDPTQPLLADPSQWNPQRWPVFRIRVRCSDGTPGYGALCTASTFAANPPDLSIATPADADFATQSLSTAVPNSPVWTLSPAENPTWITTAGKPMTVTLTGVVSDLPLDARGTPDQTVVTVAWENLPGRPDSETALIISKVKRVVIDSVELTPPPPAQLTRGVDKVTVTWRTRGADHSVLVGAGAPQTGTRDGEEASNTATFTADPEHPTVQILAFAKPDSRTPDATSVPIELSFAGPAIDHFGGHLLIVGGRPVIDFTWRVTDADYCTLSSAEGVHRETSVSRYRLIPSAEQPLAGSYTLRAVAGNVVAEATLIVSWQWVEVPVMLEMNPPLYTAVAYGPDAATVYAAILPATENTTLRTLDAASGDHLRGDITLQIPTVAALASSPLDGTLFATDRTSVWALSAAGQILAKWTASGGLTHQQGQGWHTILTPSDGTVTVVCGCPSQHVQVLAYASGAFTELTRVALAGSDSPALGTAGTDPDGSVVIAAAGQAYGRSLWTLTPWDASTLASLTLPPAVASSRQFAGVTVLADASQYLVTETANAASGPQTVTWTIDPGTGKVLAQVPTDGWVRAIATAPDRTSSFAVVAQNGGATGIRRLVPTAILPPADEPPPASGYAYGVGTDGQVWPFLVDPVGELTPASGPSVGTNVSAQSGALSRDGKSLFVGTSDQAVSQFTIGSDGALSAPPRARLPVGGNAAKINAILVSPDGQTLYVLRCQGFDGDFIVQYAIGADGSLSPLSPPSVATGQNTVDLAITPDGRRLYAYGLSGMTVHTVGAGGAIANASTSQGLGIGGNPVQVKVSIDGQSVYATSWMVGGGASIGQYSINSDGTLAPKSPESVGTGGATRRARIALAADGHTAYVSQQEANRITQYAIAPDGTLARVADFGAAAAIDVTISPDSASLYVVEGGMSVVRYPIAADGSLADPASPDGVTSGSSLLALLFRSTGF